MSFYLLNESGSVGEDVLDDAALLDSVGLAILLAVVSIIAAVVIGYVFYRKARIDNERAFDYLMNRNNSESLHIKMVRNSVATKERETLLKKGKVSSVKIICYGDQSYGGLISDKFPPVNLEVVVASPSPTIRNLIDNLTAKMIFHHTNELPTIRAYLAYSNSGKAIWACIHVYKYPDTDSSPRYNKLFTFVARSKEAIQHINGRLIDANDDSLTKLSLLIEKEFERLSSESSCNPDPESNPEPNPNPSKPPNKNSKEEHFVQEREVRFSMVDSLRNNYGYNERCIEDDLLLLR
jgi:hypothetical protein